MKIAVVDDSMEDVQRVVTYLEQFQTEHNQYICQYEQMKGAY